MGAGGGGHTTFPRGIAGAVPKFVELASVLDVSMAMAQTSGRAPDFALRSCGATGWNDEVLRSAAWASRQRKAQVEEGGRANREPGQAQPIH